MIITLCGAALAAAVAVTAPAPPGVGAPEVAGCVSDADYAKLAVGQRLSYVHSIAGADAQISRRSWTSAGRSYHERLYAMCTPRDQAHDTLTTRFMQFDGAWRAQSIDTRMGPE